MKFGQKANEINRSFFIICSVQEMKFLYVSTYTLQNVLYYMWFREKFIDCQITFYLPALFAILTRFGVFFSLIISTWFFSPLVIIINIQYILV